MKAELAASLENLNSVAAKTKRHARFQIPHTGPEDYTERWIQLDAERAVICGIRHMNLNPQRPFIDLRANFSLSSMECIEEVYRKIQAHFRVFNPGFISVQTREPIGPSPASVYMVQQARVIQALSP